MADGFSFPHAPWRAAVVKVGLTCRRRPGGRGVMSGLLFVCLLVFAVPGSIVAVFSGAKVYMGLARRRRWRGEVHPASRTLPRRTRHTLRIKVSQRQADAAIARWGTSDQLGFAWVRAVGQLRWHQVVLFSVGDGAGLVVDPIGSPRRKYVFDESCVIGPTDAVMTFPLGSSRRPRVFHALRVVGTGQSIDLAVEQADLATVLAVSKASDAANALAAAEPTQAVELARTAPGRRAKVVRVADRYTLLRRATGRKIDRASRASRRVSAVCSAVSVAAIVGIASLEHFATSHHVPMLPDPFEFQLPLGISALVFAFRALRPRRRRRTATVAESSES
ncbi:hypothetical protein KDL01_22260 [Actinospica durhamensis]|uniref:Uncharacterized protein n=1 Tax=Actinospica durhamensis TaxID=1508375 RepID=A0A941ES07_9ACTN|nr:hypothetical protein [Actinospica durhamensis]MBR7836016.1 hypothetical protein [Actinospica durhamensis]